MASRISREALFMRIAYCYSLRSTCNRGQVGSIIVMGKHLVAAGYNGAPPRLPECLDIGCDLEHGDELGCQRTVHAEANAVAHAARLGIQVGGGTCFSTHSPCKGCAQLLGAAGIERIIYDRTYRATPWELLHDLEIEVLHVGSVE